MPLGRYVVRRLLQIIPAWFIISILVFIAMRLAPGDPAMMILGKEAARPEGKAALEKLRHDMGLDRPVYVQYLIWISNAVRGDFGVSNISGRPVMELIAGRLPASLELMTVTFLISLIVSVPLGVLAALKQKTILDYSVMALAVGGVAIPGFWLGLALILLFSVTLGWLPASGYTPFTENPALNIKQVIMPALTLAVYLIATFTRFMRSDMIEVVNEDYIRTAVSKGLSGRLVVFRHALRNALIPLLTVIGVEVGSLFGGVAVIEQVFGWSGVGWLTLQAVYYRDYPMVQGAIVMVAVVYTLINFFVDVGYAFLNPRIREQYEA
jgi:peptide/nickel transport system permease protein